MIKTKLYLSRPCVTFAASGIHCICFNFPFYELNCIWFACSNFFFFLFYFY